MLDSHVWQVSTVLASTDHFIPAFSLCPCPSAAGLQPALLAEFLYRINSAADAQRTLWSPESSTGRLGCTLPSQPLLSPTLSLISWGIWYSPAPGDFPSSITPCGTCISAFSTLGHQLLSLCQLSMFLNVLTSLVSSTLPSQSLCFWAETISIIFPSVGDGTRGFTLVRQAPYH